MLWLFGQSSQSLQYYLDLMETRGRPSRFDLVNGDAISEHRRRIDAEYPGDDDPAKHAMAEFSGMPVPVLRITDPAFALNYFLDSGIAYASRRLREALDLSDSVIRYRDIDLDGSPPALLAHQYQMFETVTFADPIDWDRTPAQYFDLAWPDGSIRRVRRLDRSLFAPLSRGRIYFRADFVPPAPLFRVPGTAWTMATDALADRVMRAGITDVAFQDFVTERGQSEVVLRRGDADSNSSER
jgi:hypothetical protein